MNRLTIPRPVATRLLTQAQAQPGQTVCGLVGAREGEPRSVYPVRNCATDSQAVELDVAERGAALALMQQRDEALLAVYHSHPSTPPVPSAQQLAQLIESAAVMLIISLDTKGVLEMRAFRPHDGKAEEIALQVFL